MATRPGTTTSSADNPQDDLRILPMPSPGQDPEDFALDVALQTLKKLLDERDRAAQPKPDGSKGK
ncbi:MAG: hypothetical protein AB7P50_05635 [Alphaproteobacteria bacterium]